MIRKNLVRNFCIGTIDRPKWLDSHGYAKGRWKGKWLANCVNQWVATLGKELKLENAIRLHLLIVLHELTHAEGGIEGPCRDWDKSLSKIVLEGRTKDD